MSLSSSSLPPEEESSLSEELSTQHLARVSKHPKTLTERRPPSISLKWRVSPAVRWWMRANVFHPRPIHHIRGWEVDADSRTADSTAPHVQPQCLRRVQLHLARKWGRETKATARQP